MRHTTRQRPSLLALAFCAMVGMLGCADDDANGSADDGTGAGAADSPITDPATTDPATTDPATTDPATTDPASFAITIADHAHHVSGPVAAGAEVTVTNDDSVTHTVTSDDGLFDVSVGPGQTAVFDAPDEPGEYDFACTPHPDMTATLVVE